MKKRGVQLVLFILLICSANAYAVKYKDNFQTYKVGGSLEPNWIAQYPELVSIEVLEKNKFVRLNSYVPFMGDRDSHIEQNKIGSLDLVKELSLMWDFWVEDCNPYWKLEEGVTPQGSSGYLYYNGPNNFLNAEFKINANQTTCGSGIGQISVFKRVNGISTPLIPYTTFNFMMDEKYEGKLVLEKIGSEYLYFVYLDNKLVGSSILDVSDIKQGSILLENGGTITGFDNVVIRLEKV